jgi:hypothetical protein
MIKPCDEDRAVRLPRFHLRTLLVLVAFVAFLLAIGAELGRRRSEYLRRAAYHADQGRYGGDVFGDGVVLRFDPKTRKRDITSLAKIEHHARLAEKYQYAAAHPWLPVEADPPEPR